MERDRFDEIRDQVNVVLESLRGDIRLLAEGHAHVVESIDELRAGQKRLETGQEEMRNEMRADRARFAQFRAETRKEFRAVRAETREDFRSVRADVAVLKRQVGSLGPRRPRS